MALSKSTNTYNRQNWEQSEFPLLCQTCLGDNPYIRMIKDSYGDECRVCARPYTVFRWCPGRKMRYKRTEVCQSCAQLKNVCQTCLLDLEYGLPVQVRDSALNIKDTMPKSDVGREYFLQNLDQQMAETGRTEPGGSVGKAQAPSDMLMKLARTTPYYKRNRPHICSFWVKGECSRGEECPYRHEMPTDPDNPLSNQKLKDRYHGVNDPVADKMLQQAKDMPSLKPPEDKGITSLYIGGIDEGFTDSDIRDNFYQFGEIADIHLSGKSKFGFVTFTTRTSAEKAADATFNQLIIKGRRLKILWGRSQPTEKTTPTQLAPVPGIPSAPPPLPFDPFNLTGSEPRPPPPRGLPPPPRGLPPPGAFPPAPPGLPPPPNSHFLPPTGVPRPQVHYPSQNPAHMGAAGRK